MSRARNRETLRTVLFLSGLGAVGAGGVLASPIDEAAVAAATGGVGAVAAPVQGLATAGIGGVGMLGGAALIALSFLV